MDNQSNLEPKIVPAELITPSGVGEGNKSKVEASTSPDVAKPNELPSTPIAPTNEAKYVGLKEEEALFKNPLLDEKGFIATPKSLTNIVNSSQTKADELLRFLTKETPIQK